jgi:hypothetical protein
MLQQERNAFVRMLFGLGDKVMYTEAEFSIKKIFTKYYYYD